MLLKGMLHMLTRGKKLLLLSTFLILSIVTTLAALRGQGQKWNPDEKDNPTVVQEGVMTERQKQHSKLYERSGRRNLRNSHRSLDVVVPPPFIAPDSEKMASAIEELLRQETCDADTVIIGSVSGKTSQFTEDGSFVFTDYDIQIEEVVKNSSSAPLQLSSSIIVTRPGGAVSFNGNVIRVIDKSFQPLEVGGKYLLFLQQIPSSGAYQAINSESSFQLDQNRVRRLSTRQLPYPFPYGNDATSFLNQINSIKSTCGRRLD
jgi:hypothetical protein